MSLGYEGTENTVLELLEPQNLGRHLTWHEQRTVSAFLALVAEAGRNLQARLFEIEQEREKLRQEIERNGMDMFAAQYELSQAEAAGVVIEVGDDLPMFLPPRARPTDGMAVIEFRGPTHLRGDNGPRS